MATLAKAAAKAKSGSAKTRHGPGGKNLHGSRRPHGAAESLKKAVVRKTIKGPKGTY